jgi:hypothetical protein
MSELDVPAAFAALTKGRGAVAAADGSENKSGGAAAPAAAVVKDALYVEQWCSFQAELAAIVAVGGTTNEIK